MEHPWSVALVYTFKLTHKNSCCRLMDCIERLDNMERHGSLNMDKVNCSLIFTSYSIYEFWLVGNLLKIPLQVYHAGFFQACKSQKAVKEAFRFTKLIQNPTLSTFNMLLSVCASSRDLEGKFSFSWYLFLFLFV